MRVSSDPVVRCLATHAGNVDYELDRKASDHGMGFVLRFVDFLASSPDGVTEEEIYAKFGRSDGQKMIATLPAFCNFDRTTFKFSLNTDSQKLIRQQPRECDSSVYFNSAGSFVPMWLADELLHAFHCATMIGGKMYVYRDGFYRSTGRELIEAETQRRLGEDVRMTHVREVVGIVQRATYTPSEKFNSSLWSVNLKNGLLDMRTMTISPHTHEIISTVRVPVSYDPKADCPAIKKFLSEVLSEEDVPKVVELIGYCLYREYIIHKAFMFLGDGRNGKTTLIELIKTFLGAANCSGENLQSLVLNKFAPARLHGKLANLYPDVPSKALQQTGVFKMLTGNDTFGAELKFKDGFTFKNYAKLIFSANQLPATKDDTDAYYRRWEIITFPNTFDGAAADKNILSKLTTDEELSGLFNMALEGLKHLLGGGCFSGETNIDEMREKYTKLSDSVGAFLMECVEQSSDGFIEKKKIYASYCEYCRSVKVPIRSEKSFHSNTPRYVNVDSVYMSLSNGRKWVWKGIKLKGDLPSLARPTSSASVSDFVSDVGSPEKKLIRIIEDNAIGSSGAFIDDVLLDAKKSGIDELDRLMEKLYDEGVIFNPKPDTVKLM